MQYKTELGKIELLATGSDIAERPQFIEDMNGLINAINEAMDERQYPLVCGGFLPLKPHEEYNKVPEWWTTEYFRRVAKVEGYMPRFYEGIRVKVIDNGCQVKVLYSLPPQYMFVIQGHPDACDNDIRKALADIYEVCEAYKTTEQKASIERAKKGLLW